MENPTNTPTSEEINDAIKPGSNKTVYWKNHAYVIVSHSLGPMIKCTVTKGMIGLFQHDGTPNVPLSEIIIEDNHE